MINFKVRHRINKAGNLQISKYMEIAQYSGKYLSEYIIDNNYYGVGYSLKEYIGRNKPLNAFIEHGYIFGSFVDLSCNIWYPQCIITFGKVRKRHLQKKTSKNIIPIGPYIHYAKDYLNDLDFQKAKNKYGKMLLVIPVHGPTGGQIAYDMNILVDQIDDMKAQYDTIAVCLFYSDIQNHEVVNFYKKKGYQLFCAGDRYDWNFLSRLKSIIKLSDFTVSNYPGTHVGYCIYMGKPHWLIEQKVVRKPITEKGFHNLFTIRNDSEFASLESELREVSTAFTDYSENISEHQLELVEKYWGTSDGG